jgi:hypothetical protein
MGCERCQCLCVCSESCVSPFPCARCLPTPAHPTPTPPHPTPTPPHPTPTPPHPTSPYITPPQSIGDKSRIPDALARAKDKNDPFRCAPSRPCAPRPAAPVRLPLPPLCVPPCIAALRGRRRRAQLGGTLPAALCGAIPAAPRRSLRCRRRLLPGWAALATASTRWEWRARACRSGCARQPLPAHPAPANGPNTHSLRNRRAPAPHHPPHTHTRTHTHPPTHTHTSTPRPAPVQTYDPRARMMKQICDELLEAYGVE